MVVSTAGLEGPWWAAVHAAGRRAPTHLICPHVMVVGLHTLYLVALDGRGQGSRAHSISCFSAHPNAAHRWVSDSIFHHSFSRDKISLDCVPLSLWGSFLLDSLSWDLLMGVYRSSQLPIFCSATLSSVVCFFLNFRICDIYLFLTLAHDILEKIITHWNLIIYTPQVIFIFYIAMKTS